MFSKFATTRGRIVLGFAALSLAISGLSHALSLSGTPSAATVGQSYQFRPTVTGQSGQLAYRIESRFAWLKINSSTGVISGVPTTPDAGTSYLTLIVRDAKTSQMIKLGIPVKSAAAAGSNKAPTISGTPSINTVYGRPYTFTPKAADANNDKLTFSIQNKASWMAFNTSTGAITGTPQAKGTFSNIVVSVSDGKVATSLRAFNVTVAAVSMGDATLRWKAPTADENGQSITGLAGYRVLYGTSPDKLNQRLEVPGAATTSVRIEELTSGTYYFAVRAYTKAGDESLMSEIVYKQII